MNNPTMKVKVDGVLQEREYYYDYTEGISLGLLSKIPVVKENEHLMMTLAGIPEIITLWEE